MKTIKPDIPGYSPFGKRPAPPAKPPPKNPEKPVVKIKVKSDFVICPYCVNQFPAIPMDVQKEIESLRSDNKKLRGILTNEREWMARDMNEMRKYVYALVDLFK